MFNNTFGVIDKIVSDFKKVLFVIQILSLSIGIVYLCYAIINTNKLLVNIPLLLITVAYLFFYLVKHDKIDDESKFAKRITKKIYKWSKIVIKGISLAITIMACHSLTGKPDFLTVTLALIMAFAWIFSVLLELINIFVNNRINLLKEAFSMDVKEIKKPFTSIENIAKRIKGEEVVETPPSKSGLKIKKWAAERIQRKKLQKQLRKEAKQSQKNTIKEEAHT